MDILLNQLYEQNKKFKQKKFIEREKFNKGESSISDFSFKKSFQEENDDFLINEKVFIVNEKPFKII